jgi:spermidine synthase
MSPLLYGAFFASGASALIYEAAWVRQLGHVFGNTLHSTAVVTGVFVLGLGLGGEAAGRIADVLARRPAAALVRVYAALEIFIAIWGLGLCFILPALVDSPFPPSSYAVDSRGWHHGSGGTYAVQVLVAGLLVAAPACAMGATLVVLVRSILHSSLARVAAATSRLYAVNTAGAAIGALVVDAALVPAIGVSGAQAAAASLNLTAALFALLCLKRGSATAGEAATAADGSRTAPRFLPWQRALLCAVFLAGLTGMALEITWFRYLSSLLGAHRATLSLVLVVILVGIWLGSLVVGSLAQRTKRPLFVFVATQALLATTASVTVVPSVRGAATGFAGLLIPILVVVGLPSLCLGTSFPLANAALQEDLRLVGRRAGRIYLANSTGGLAGTTLAGFVLLPSLGLQRTLLVVIAAIAATLVLLVPGAWREAARAAHGNGPTRRSRFGLLACAAVTALALVGFGVLPRKSLLERMYDADVRHHAILFSEGLTETIAITERRDLEATPQRVLYVNGVLMSGTVVGAQRYMRAMAHVPLLQLEAPKRALVICFGIGNTANAVSLHPSIERIEIADLSRQILEHAPMFTRWNGGVLDDPRTRVFVHDGRHHLRMQAPDSYDLVTLEPPPIAQAGVGALYAREFYALAKSRLRAGGFLTQWLPAYQVRADAAISMVRAFLDVFPDAVLLSGYERHLILVGRKGAPNQIDPTELRARLLDRPLVRQDLEKIDLGSARAILGTFAAAGATLDMATAGVAPASDDWPVSEYTWTLWPKAGRPLPQQLFNVSQIIEWCPRCIVDGRMDPALDGLVETLRYLGAWYQSDHYRKAVGAPHAAPMVWNLPDPDGALGRVVRADRYLSWLSAGPSEAVGRHGDSRD